MFNKTIHTVFFKLWIWLIRITCLMFLVIQSHTLNTMFTLYVVAVLLTIRYALQISEKYKSLNKDLQKVVAWTVLVLMASIVAWGLAVITDTDSFTGTVWNFLIISAETTVLMYSTYFMVRLVDWLTSRKKKKLKGKKSEGVKKTI